MKKIISLTKVMLKSSFTGFSSSKKKKSKLKKVLGVLGIIALYAYLSVVVFFLAKDLIEVFYNLKQTTTLINLLFTAASFYGLVIAILSIPAVFYFSKDIETLLPMPIRSFDILIAKTFTTYVSLLVSLSFILIPFLVAYQIVVSASFSFILLFLLAYFIIPIIPLALALILVILLFTFIPKINNKDLFTYFSSFLSIGIILAINSLTLGDAGFLENLTSANSDLVANISTFLPSVAFLAEGVVNSNILLVIAVLLLSLFLIFIVSKLISPLYFKGAIGISESNSKKKSKRKVKKSSGKINSRIKSFIYTDTKNILRTPAFAINYFLPLLILPIFFAFPIITIFTSGEVSMAEFTSLMNEASVIINSMDLSVLIPYVIIGSFVFTFFISSTSSITLTAFSREGERMEFFKSLPIEMMTIIKAKIIMGSIISLIMPTIVLIAITIILKPNVVLLIVSLVTVVISAVFSNVFDIIVDVYKPKLVWDDETQAIKQNFMTIIPVFTSFFIIGIFVAAFVFLNNNRLLFSIALLFILLAASYFIFKVVIEKYGLKHLDKAIEKI